MKVFLSGIAGTGMSALAGLFSRRGDEVYGSDVHFYPPVDGILEGMNARIFQGYDARNIPADIDCCVVGNVISRGNPEAEFILNKGLAYYSMPEALYRFFVKGRKSVVVAGTHGKTTIASFVAHLLTCAGLSPGFFIGGKPLNFDVNYAIGQGDYFVIEGDEYETSFFDRSSKFLKYHPYYLILTACEYDHLDFFPLESLYIKSFTNLVNQVPSDGLIVSSGDFPMNRQVVTKSFTPLVAYGSGDCDVHIKNIKFRQGFYHFTIENNSLNLQCRTPLLGRYNIWNLTAGIVLGIHLGIADPVIQEAVATFKGVERRLNPINRIQNTLILEDFAHHPTSIRGILESVREIFPDRKIISLFEPRSWSLRRNFFQDRLSKSFSPSHEVVMKDVFEKEKIPENERLDLSRVKDELLESGIGGLIFDDYNKIKEYLLSLDFNTPTVILVISNGSFGDIPEFLRNLR
jgi:UDP-N-acetylmuramate: L-alanyl-gamma-D-glutamyl-meso-diaminopimelate ligase